MTLREHLHMADLASQANPGTKAAWRAYRTLVRMQRNARQQGAPVERELEVGMDGLNIHGFGHPQLFHLYKEIFLKQDYAMELGTDAPMIVDCGSNIGTSIAFFKRLYPKARIVGFEPHPTLFPVLKGNMERNGLKDVELHNCALGKDPGVVPFHVSRNPGSLRSSMRADRGGEVCIEVPLERLSDHLRRLERVDLLKIDVEGGEKAILEDLAGAGMLVKPLHYVLEYHLNIGEDRSDLSSTLRLFEENGFDYNLHAERKRNSRFQDVLIYCTRRGT